ncbi:leucine-rich repeat-containing protein 52 [Meriones unguiculatus]|uniref:leucine-rich repeat-containing protein 52 n=1 Tax=Meriones unguiculatus TaxID=10047 RepID=UPI000B4E947A|nr:leucine-rich repeat-containing protein 52 [Meriones unguiculatus]
MFLASDPGPQLLLLFSFGMGMAAGSKCPQNCLCQDQEVACTDLELTEYPDDIPLNTRRLFLNNNKITSLPALQLGFLSDLVYLDCQKNRIREVMDYTFIGVFKLIYLDLSSNNLTFISPNSFSVLGNLVRLNISNNPHLLYLDKYTFANTSSLRYLDLRNTGLQTIDEDAFQHLVVLNTMYLSGNPWNCNCSFLDFAIHLLVSHMETPDGQIAMCTEPTELRGWPITRVGNPLQYMCITHLDSHDYIFLLLIGFCIFAAGTVAAWLTGMCAVLYQNAHRKSSGDDSEEENRFANQIFRSHTNFSQGRFPQLI